MAPFSVDNDNILYEMKHSALNYKFLNLKIRFLCYIERRPEETFLFLQC